MRITKFFRQPALSESAAEQVLARAANLSLTVNRIASESCFYVQSEEELSGDELKKLAWLLSETFEPDNFGVESFLSHCPQIVEIGPRLNFETAWSSTAVSICDECGISGIKRMERSMRFGLDVTFGPEQRAELFASHCDRMTQMFYDAPLKSFDIGITPEPVRTIMVLELGIGALEEINHQLGLSMDRQDLELYYDLFKNQLMRNPTDVEMFQIGTANAEHCRHWFFKGYLTINGNVVASPLMDIIKAPWKVNPGNSVIAFCDDSSAIEGCRVKAFMPFFQDKPSAFAVIERVYNPTLTAETHNFPSGIAPFPGAETGTGGRIRDNQCVGRGGLVIAAGAAYCVDNLHIPGYKLPWEDEWRHPRNLASPLDILIQASNGASDYGNKFGEPVIYGFTRSLGMEMPDGSRRGCFKPTMYTVGAGQMDATHSKKVEPEKGMLLVQIGGPAYRIGLGGGPASSMIQGDNLAELDFSAVQRGAAQMAQRVNRVVRAAVEMGHGNPFVSAHDLGAGGDLNALSELADPAGALIELRSIPLGDATLSVLEYWGNESQERNAFLVWPSRFDEVKAIADREGAPCVIVGRITGDGILILHDSNDGTTPVCLPLEKILGSLPPKSFNLERVKPELKQILLPISITITEALGRVLRLVSVGSKRFLTTKVDRSVTGLIAQQQCVGPHQITLCDFAAISQSYFGLHGVALSLGEQPVKGLISPQAMARLAVAEALLNMAGAKITSIRDIKCSANWMLAAKLPGEGAWLYDAACALRDILMELGMAIDGGKDSLSMAAKTLSPAGEMKIVKAPGQLVIANYARMPDITRKATPDFKQDGSMIVFIDLSGGKCRLGGSALAQVYSQVGDECPDVEDVGLLARTFNAVQYLVDEKFALSVHDKSDGGLIVCLLEMAFAGNIGFNVRLNRRASRLSLLFNEEPGLVLEVNNSKALEYLNRKKIPFDVIGNVGNTNGKRAEVFINGSCVISEDIKRLLAVWEETSGRIDEIQATPDCVRSETESIYSTLRNPPFYLSFDPDEKRTKSRSRKPKERVAVLRGKGSNGDREMAAAFKLAGFSPWDVTMSDLISGKVNLDFFRGIAFVGGFAYADVMDAGKGWAGAIRFNKAVSLQFDKFYKRGDSFSLGVCNGCQLMALMGWVPFYNLADQSRPRFIRNISGRFESRFGFGGLVTILPSPAIMLSGMEGSTLGVWVAHGEGRCVFPDASVFSAVNEQLLAPIRFVDFNSEVTEKYPFNPNGSVKGITALCSPDGRHLAMMPHPERSFLKWQWGYWPQKWSDITKSPWMRFFENAAQWCRK